jgi:WD40 repeat protein
VSADGKRFLAGENHAVRLFDFASGKVLKSYEEEHKEWEVVYAVAFSPDGKRALSAGGDSDPSQKRPADAVLLGLPK